MSVGRIVIVGDKELRRTLRRLGPAGRRISAKALNRVGFELREAEADEADEAFEFSGASTRRFIASPRSFVFDKARPSKPTLTFMPSRRTDSLLSEHEAGSLINADDGEVDRLEYEGKLAVPIAVKRGARGRVRKRDRLPEVLSRPGVRKARSGRSIIEFHSAGIRVLYALVEAAKLDERFDFFSTAEKTVRRELPRKYRREFEKEIERGFSR